ncbi:hypothetical protein BGW42_004737 [Actinomortierella wolfii]|nr:hypothetical protein BGW42_004737 [Actinomortierella wolfii]
MASFPGAPYPFAPRPFPGPQQGQQQQQNSERDRQQHQRQQQEQQHQQSYVVPLNPPPSLHAVPQPATTRAHSQWQPQLNTQQYPAQGVKHLPHSQQPQQPSAHFTSAQQYRPPAHLAQTQARQQQQQQASSSQPSFNYVGRDAFQAAVPSKRRGSPGFLEPRAHPVTSNQPSSSRSPPQLSASSMPPQQHSKKKKKAKLANTANKVVVGGQSSTGGNNIPLGKPPQPSKVPMPVKAHQPSRATRHDSASTQAVKGPNSAKAPPPAKKSKPNPAQNIKAIAAQKGKANANANVSDPSYAVYKRKLAAFHDDSMKEDSEARAVLFGLTKAEEHQLQSLQQSASWTVFESMLWILSRGGFVYRNTMLISMLYGSTFNPRGGQEEVELLLMSPLFRPFLMVIVRNGMFFFRLDPNRIEATLSSSDLGGAKIQFPPVLVGLRDKGHFDEEMIPSKWVHFIQPIVRSAMLAKASKGFQAAFPYTGMLLPSTYSFTGDLMGLEKRVPYWDGLLIVLDLVDSMPKNNWERKHALLELYVSVAKAIGGTFDKIMADLREDAETLARIARVRAKSTYHQSELLSVGATSSSGAVGDAVETDDTITASISVYDDVELTGSDVTDDEDYDEPISSHTSPPPAWNLKRDESPVRKPVTGGVTATATNSSVSSVVSGRQPSGERAQDKQQDRSGRSKSRDRSRSKDRSRYRSRSRSIEEERERDRERYNHHRDDRSRNHDRYRDWDRTWERHLRLDRDQRDSRYSNKSRSRSRSRSPQRYRRDDDYRRRSPTPPSSSSQSRSVSSRPYSASSSSASPSQHRSTAMDARTFGQGVEVKTESSSHARAPSSSSSTSTLSYASSSTFRDRAAPTRAIPPSSQGTTRPNASPAQVPKMAAMASSALKPSTVPNTVSRDKESVVQERSESKRQDSSLPNNKVPSGGQDVKSTTPALTEKLAVTSTGSASDTREKGAETPLQNPDLKLSLATGEVSSALLSSSTPGNTDRTRNAAEVMFMNNEGKQQQQSVAPSSTDAQKQGLAASATSVATVSTDTAMTSVSMPHMPHMPLIPPMPPMPPMPSTFVTAGAGGMPPSDVPPMAPLHGQRPPYLQHPHVQSPLPPLLPLSAAAAPSSSSRPLSRADYFKARREAMKAIENYVMTLPLNMNEDKGTNPTDN